MVDHSKDFVNDLIRGLSLDKLRGPEIQSIINACFEELQERKKRQMQRRGWNTQLHKNQTKK